MKISKTSSASRIKRVARKLGESVLKKSREARGVPVTAALKPAETASGFAKASGKSNPLSVTPAQLTEREFQVLELLAKGCPAKEIHDKLNISVHTVNEHLHNIYHKLHITNCREAVRWYCDHQGKPYPRTGENP